MSNNFLVGALKSAGAVKFGTFTLRNGATTNIYFDMRIVVSHPVLLADISFELSLRVPGGERLMVAGVPLGGLPYACMVSQIAKIPMILVRDAKKEHGLGKTVEGSYSVGDRVVLIEDVVTTGGGVLDAISILEREGLKVVKVIAIVDRGGLKNIEENGYPSLALFNTADFVSVPPTRKIDQANTKILMNIISTKQTNLVVSLDLRSHHEILAMLSIIGPYICAVKLHFDIIKFEDTDQRTDFSILLSILAMEKRFLIIEDRKFSDIPSISLEQYNTSIADMVTVHGICGEELVEKFTNKGIGVLLIHGLSVKGNLIDSIYAAKVRAMGVKYSVMGFIGQGPVHPNFLTFTPGISLDVTTDHKGQSYRHPDEVDSDIFIVGRGIYESDNVEKAAIRYRDACFKKWKHSPRVEF